MSQSAVDVQKPGLESLRSQLRAAKVEADRLWDDAGAEALLKRPAGGGWAAAECLEHLNRFAEHSLKVVSEALEQAPGAAPEALPSYRVRRHIGLLIRSFEPPIRLRTKTAEAFAPPSRLDPVAVKLEYDRLHEALHAQLSDLEGVDLSRLRVRSPMLRWLSYNLYEWWLLLLAHERRHLWQAEQVMASV